MIYFQFLISVVNIGATALVTEAATAILGEAGVSAATGVMTVCLFSPPLS
jgi:Mg2+/Co2+ transporter CorB